MIEADLDSQVKDRNVNLLTNAKGKFVTFERFASEYWPHFNQASTKRLRESGLYIVACI